MIKYAELQDCLDIARQHNGEGSLMFTNAINDLRLQARFNNTSDFTYDLLNVLNSYKLPASEAIRAKYFPVPEYDPSRDFASSAGKVAMFKRLYNIVENAGGILEIKYYYVQVFNNNAIVISAHNPKDSYNGYQEPQHVCAMELVGNDVVIHGSWSIFAIAGFIQQRKCIIYDNEAQELVLIYRHPITLKLTPVEVVTFMNTVSSMKGKTCSNIEYYETVESLTSDLINAGYTKLPSPKGSGLYAGFLEDSVGVLRVVYLEDKTVYCIIVPLDLEDF